MIKTWRVASKRAALVGPTISRRCGISALFLSGDKAKENYMALHPFMDFKGTLADTKSLADSISARGWRVDLNGVLKKYAIFQELEAQMQQVEREREALSRQLKALTKSADYAATEGQALKERGRNLRNSLKQIKEKSYPIEYDFVCEFLNLPNILHPNCPRDGGEKLLYRSSVSTAKSESHLQNNELVHYIDNSRYYMLGMAAEFDLRSMHALTNYFVESGGFTQIANPDFVRRVLLEANATPKENYHLVVEEHLQNKINSAHLTGGGSFEAFLGAFTKLCVYPSVLPLRLVGCGRNYERCEEKTANEGRKNLFTVTQTNAVQTFIVTQSAQEADQQMEVVLNLAVNFYKKLGIDFRLRYVDARQLTAAECLRAVIEVYSPAEQRYICVGRISNYADFVSKRILFSMRQQKDYHFLHLVGGPVLYTTPLIAVLIEHGIKLENCPLLGDCKNEIDNTSAVKAIEEFKSLFK